MEQRFQSARMTKNLDFTLLTRPRGEIDWSY